MTNRKLASKKVATKKTSKKPVSRKPRKPVPSKKPKSVRLSGNIKSRKSRRRTIYIIGENHANTIATSLELANIMQRHPRHIPLFFGEKGQQARHSGYNIIEENNISSDIALGIYAYGFLYDYDTGTRNYEILASTLVDRGYLDRYIRPNSSSDWMDIAKRNLIDFIQRNMILVGVSQNLQESIIINLNNGDYLTAISLSENFRDENIRDIIREHDNTNILQPFVVIVGENHVRHLSSLLTNYNVINIVSKKPRKPLSKKPRKPVSKKPRKPLSKKPVSKKPVSKKPVSRKPRKPVSRKPRKPVSRKPRKPVSKKPVSKKPVSRKPRKPRKPVSRKPVSKKETSNKKDSKKINNNHSDINLPLDNDKILFKKYNTQKSSTNFGNKSFYEKGKLYFLTNGANQYLSNIGGGTTGTLDSMGGEKYFLDARKYDKKSNVLQSYPSKNVGSVDSRGMINDNDVYYCEVKEDKYPITGVFHIKGKNWQNIDRSSQMGKTNIKNIHDYYKAVIEIANDIAMKFPKQKYVLHLSCIPGAIYAGGDATKIGMKKAINDTMSSLSSNLQIQVDMDKKEYANF